MINPAKLTDEQRAEFRKAREQVDAAIATLAALWDETELPVEAYGALYRPLEYVRMQLRQGVPD